MKLITDSELLRLMLGPGATDDRATNERLAAVVLAKERDREGTTYPELRKIMLSGTDEQNRVTQERLDELASRAKREDEGKCCAQCGERLKGDRALRMGVCELCEDESV